MPHQMKHTWNIVFFFLNGIMFWHLITITHENTPINDHYLMAYVNKEHSDQIMLVLADMSLSSSHKESARDM